MNVSVTESMQINCMLHFEFGGMTACLNTTVPKLAWRDCGSLPLVNKVLEQSITKGLIKRGVGQKCLLAYRI
jgi:hypothetical protein